MGMVHPQYMGVKKLVFYLTVELQRKGTEIVMRLARFEIEHDIKRRIISAENLQEAMKHGTDKLWVRKWCS
jgi:hypothetical protein